MSCLALASLAFQLALSFGHVHLGHVRGEAHAATIIEASTIAAVSDERHARPADHDAPEHEDEYCAIYAINSLIGFAQIAIPPALRLPPPSNQARPCARHPSHLAATHRGFSRARAPPIA